LVARARTRLGGDERQALAEALQAVDRAHHRSSLRPPLPSRPFRKAHVLLDAVDDAQLPSTERATTMWKLFEPRSTAASSSPSGSAARAEGALRAHRASVSSRRPARVGALALGREDAAVAAVRVQAPGLLVVAQVVGQLLVEHALREHRVEDREAGLDAAQQVALHPVGAGAEGLGLAAVGEPVHAAVLEEAADQPSAR
jgi:hypothetical protein